MKLQQLIARMLRPLQRRVDLMIARAIVRAVDPSARRQTVQVALLDGELAAGVEHMEPYGFTSHPHRGGGGVALFVGGSRAHGVLICAGGKTYRLKNLTEGEVALYTDEGDYIHFKRGGEIAVRAAAKVRLESPLAECTGDAYIAGDLAVDGNITAGGDITASGTVTGEVDVIAAGVSLKSHTHGGVTAGGASTAPPN